MGENKKVKRFIFPRNGRPVVITLGNVKVQIPGGYSEHDSDFIDAVMATPQGKDLVALSEEASAARRVDLDKAAKAKVAAEEEQKRLEKENLKKMAEALKLHEVRVANNERDNKIKELKEGIVDAKDAIASFEKDIVEKTALLKKLEDSKVKEPETKDEGQSSEKTKTKKPGE